jgi:peptidoglycan/LPS O-acetylase OafA/YrhL
MPHDNMRTRHPGVAAGANANRRIDDIEVLRAIAIIVTLVAHIPYLLFWGDPSYDRLSARLSFLGGVDLFFAISGFVIARDLIPRLRAVESNVTFWRITGAFWIRRAFRILPSAWIWGCAGLLAAMFFNESNAFGTVRGNFNSVVANVLQVANLHWWSCSVGLSDCGYNAIFWSLSVEEQFYVVLPLLYLVARRRFVAALAILALVQALAPRPPWSLLWFMRTDALMLGVLLAIWSQRDSYRLYEPTFLRNRWVAWAATAALLFCVLVFPENLPVGKIGVTPFPLGLLARVCCIWVWIASYDRGYILQTGWLKRACLWVGTRSFALYLIHIPVFYAVREIYFCIEPAGTIFDEKFTLPFLVSALPALLIIAELNYRLVENPLRRRGAEIAARFLQDGTRSGRTKAWAWESARRLRSVLSRWGNRFGKPVA